MKNGHTDAMQYPLWMVTAHTRIMRNVSNNMLASEMLLLQMAAGSIIGGKEVSKAFSDEIRKLVKDD